MSFWKREFEEMAQARPEADPAATFGNCDLALFRNGRHCDISIQCGGQQFDVHKAIVYGRCGWFKKIIDEMGEAPDQGQLPIIEVTNHEPNDIEAILVFIYSGEIDPNFFPNDAYPSSCVRLYNLGHVFEVTNLCDFATTELGNYLSNVLKSICDRRLWAPAANKTTRRTEIQDRLRGANFMHNYLAAVERADHVRRAGATELERLRPYKMLVDFFIAGEPLLLDEPEFELWLESDVVPSFAKSVMLTRKKGGCRSRWMLRLADNAANATMNTSRQCVDCHTSFENTKQCGGGVGLVNSRSWKGTYTQAVCRTCLNKDKNLGDDGFPLWDIFSRQEEWKKGKEKNGK